MGSTSFLLRIYMSLSGIITGLTLISRSAAIITEREILHLDSRVPSSWPSHSSTFSSSQSAVSDQANVSNTYMMNQTFDREPDMVFHHACNSTFSWSKVRVIWAIQNRDRMYVMRSCTLMNFALPFLCFIGQRLGRWSGAYFCSLLGIWMSWISSWDTLASGRWMGSCALRIVSGIPLKARIWSIV